MSRAFYNRFLILIAGLGGLLYGIDVGIIAAALLYLGKTVSLSLAQTSIVVAAVLGGSMLSSPVAGVLAEWFGRKRMMAVSGLMFVASVIIIVLSHGFISLLLGRLLQGMSGGMIAVVVPLYLAECLSPQTRGQGTAVFQFMLAFGIVVAALLGWFFTRQAELSITHAAGDALLIRAAENHAWRSMFLAVVYPGTLFFAGVFALSESPRWLYRRGQPEEALRSLLRSHAPADARHEIEEMGAVAAVPAQAAHLLRKEQLLQRKYILPFLLACIVLACNQATGINSVLGFLVVILRQAGLSATYATQGDLAVKVLNCVMTLVAVVLVDRKGRRFLLRWGTGGIIVALVCGALLFDGIESRRVDVKSPVVAAEAGNTLTLPVRDLVPPVDRNRPMVLSVLYSWGQGRHIAAVSTADRDPVLVLQPDRGDAGRRLAIQKALLDPVPTRTISWMITACMAVFITAYAIGPGVVVWLVLSEMIPARIRSVGMGIALLFNQGVSTLIAAVFLPVVGEYGYSVMFFVWAGATVLYFATSTFFLPETKGRTLEEIEMYFSPRSTAAR
jgi:MFS family permease